MDKAKKGGWSLDSGTSNVKVDLSQKAVKKTNNIWEQQEEEVVDIPDIEDEAFDKRSKNVAGNISQAITKVQDLTELYRDVKQVSLPPPDDDIDLSSLVATLRPPDELMEKDEQWEFVHLKNEVYEVINNLYSQIAMNGEIV